MPSYLTGVYAFKTLEVSVLTGAVASSPLEAQIQAHILEGNQAFFKRHYPKALSHYLAALGACFPQLVYVVFPPAVGLIAPERLLALDLVSPMLEASVEIHRLRPSLGQAPQITPPIDLPPDLVELTDRYAGSADKALRSQRLSVAFRQQGELNLARHHAEEALAAASDEQRGDGFALTAAIALASADVDHDSPPSSRARMEPASRSIGGASTTTAGASIGASAMPRGVASMRASGRGARWRDRCLQPATHRSPIGQVVRREAGRQVLLFSRDDHERHQRHRWHEGDE